MRTKTVDIYQFDELSDRSKEAALDWWRTLESQSFDSEFCFDDAERIAEILGIEFDQKSISLMNGSTRNEPKIWFTGFCSQGDGACFDGSYRYKKGAAKAIRKYAPLDETLHQIADDLQAIQKPNFYQLYASTNHSGHYYHSGCMSVSVNRDSDNYQDMTGDAEDVIIDALRAFANWIYCQLEKEYEWIMSDEQVTEAIFINEYEFDESGAIA